MYRMIEIANSITLDSLVSVIDTVRPKGFYFSGEMHDFWEIVFVRSGHAMAVADERLYRLSPGQMLFHKPMEFHRIWSDGNSSPHLMIISFRASGEGMENFREKCFCVEPEMFAEYEKIVHLFKKAVNSYEHEDSECGVLAEYIAASIKLFLLKLTEMKNQKPHAFAEDEIRYQTIMKVMKEHCCENLTVEEIAMLCDMSASTLKRNFAKFSDKGVAQVFRTLKMRKAMQLLSDGEKAANVAVIVGFNDPAYFHTVFKREFGITPLEYKKSKNK